MRPVCIIDGEPLDDLEHGLFRCSVHGIYYPGDMFAEADETDIRRIIDEKLACGKCEQALPGIPRVYCDDDGRPIPCPTHGPKAKKRRLGWWRWRRRASVPS